MDVKYLCKKCEHYDKDAQRYDDFCVNECEYYLKLPRCQQMVDVGYKTLQRCTKRSADLVRYKGKMTCCDCLNEEFEPIDSVNFLSSPGNPGQLGDQSRMPPKPQDITVVSKFGKKLIKKMKENGWHKGNMDNILAPHGSET
jgi:hypothetical protein